MEWNFFIKLSEISPDTMCSYKMKIKQNPGSYLFRGPSDQTVDLSVSFTLETNSVSLTEQTKLAQQTIQMT